MNSMCADSMCTKLCGRLSLVKKIWNADKKKKNEEDEFAIGVYRNDFQKETLVKMYEVDNRF